MNIAASRWSVVLAALIAFGLCAGRPAMAQPYPDKPIRFVIGFPPGTIIDAVGRIVTAEMSKQLGQSIVLDFRPGANATIGARHVMSAPADGYTLFFGTASTIHPILNRFNGVEAGKEFASVAAIATAPFFMLSKADLPVRSLQDFTAHAKSKADGLTYGAPSAPAFLLMRVFRDRTGVEARAIPYKNSAQLSVALLAGEVDVAPATALSFLPHIRAGKVRALFILAPKRSSLLPGVPTAAELGIRNFEFATNIGLWAPPATPREVVQKLNAEATAALRVPAVAEQVRTIAGAEPVGSTPEGQLAIYDADVKSWGEAARLADFRPE